MREALAEAGLRAEIDDRSERMQAKVRDAQEQKIPVMLVLGDRDQRRAVSWRLRTGDVAGRVVGGLSRIELVGLPSSRAVARRDEATCRCPHESPPRMRKMRGVGQLASLGRSTRVAEFYESAFGFQRRAGRGGVDLELSGFDQLPPREKGDPRGDADRVSARHRRRCRRVGAGAGAAGLRWWPAVGRPMGGLRSFRWPIPRGGRSPFSTPTPTEAYLRRLGTTPGSTNGGRRLEREETTITRWARPKASRRLRPADPSDRC